MRIPFLNNSKKSIVNCLQNIADIRKSSEIIAICPTPTDYSWLGVQVATLSLFPNCTFQIPQDYSNQTLSDEQLVKIAQTINDLEYKQVVFSGFLPYFVKIMNVIKPQMAIKVLYHGFLSELSRNEKQSSAFAEMLELLKSKQVQAIGCVKKGLAQSISKMLGVRSCEIILPNTYIADDIIPMSDRINIGCLVNTSFRKNIHNQAMAVLMVKKSVLHAFKTTELAYLPQDRIKYYSLMNHADFIDLLSRMSVNMHVTFSESWGQVLSESISQGVPCLSAYTSSFFDYDEDLKQKLVVDGFDDSWHIYKKLEDVLKDRDAIGRQCIGYAKRLNVLAEERIREFLN